MKYKYRMEVINPVVPNHVYYSCSRCGTFDGYEDHILYNDRNDEIIKLKQCWQLYDLSRYCTKCIEWLEDNDPAFGLGLRACL